MTDLIGEKRKGIQPPLHTQRGIGRQGIMPWSTSKENTCVRNKMFGAPSITSRK